LKPRTTYYFWVRTADEFVNYSAWSDTKTVVAGSFVEINAGLPGVNASSSLSWGDYDNDGDLDLALSGQSTGQSYSGFISRIYRNDNGVFIDINAGLPGIDFGSLSWGDYDNDGDLDLVLSGSTGSSLISKIYRNDNGVFMDINAGLPGAGYNGKYTSLSWGDYDNDGDLDIVLAGDNGSGSISKI
jgi:hypothetical protein